MRKLPGRDELPSCHEGWGGVWPRSQCWTNRRPAEHAVVRVVSWKRFTKKCVRQGRPEHVEAGRGGVGKVKQGRKVSSMCVQLHLLLF